MLVQLLMLILIQQTDIIDYVSKNASIDYLVDVKEAKHIML